MRHLAYVILCVCVLPASRLPAGDGKPEPGYTLLFNGKNLDGWHEAAGKKASLAGKTEAFGGRFKVMDGMLVYDPSVKGDRYIETVKQFGKDVSIKLDFKPGPKCNNDVFLRGIKFDIVPGNKECKNVKQGEWSTLEIVVTGERVEHKINGTIGAHVEGESRIDAAQASRGVRRDGGQEHLREGMSDTVNYGCHSNFFGSICSPPLRVMRLRMVCSSTVVGRKRKDASTNAAKKPGRWPTGMHSKRIARPSPAPRAAAVPWDRTRGRRVSSTAPARPTPRQGWCYWCRRESHRGA